MCELMTEPVRMQPFDACLQSPSFHHLADTAVGHRTFTTQPQGVCCWCEWMLRPCPDVPAQCLPGPVTKRRGAFPPALAENQGNILLEVEISEGDPDQLGDSETRVQEEAE